MEPWGGVGNGAAMKEEGEEENSDIRGNPLDRYHH